MKPSQAPGENDPNEGHNPAQAGIRLLAKHLGLCVGRDQAVENKLAVTGRWVVMEGGVWVPGKPIRRLLLTKVVGTP